MKIRNLALSALAAVALVFGGISAAAPAQAVVGSTVAFGYADPSLSVRTIKVTNTDGVTRNYGVGAAPRNVFRVCAPSLASRLVLIAPNGSRIQTTAGGCHTPTQRGSYNTSLFKA